MVEQRSVKRIPVTFHVSFGPVAAGKQEGKISDLALKGCRLESRAPIAVNTYLQLWIEISPRVPRILVDLAAVRWVLNGQAGIEFLSLRPEHKAELERVMEEQPE
jgi:PilZ domain